MKRTKNLLSMFVFLSIPLLVGCGILFNKNDEGGVGGASFSIVLTSPRFPELLEKDEMYKTVDVTVKFTKSDNSIISCTDVSLDFDMNLSANCGSFKPGKYTYAIEYMYEELVIAKSEGEVTIGSGKNSINLAALNKNWDEDKDGFSNLKEFLVGTKPRELKSCPVEDLAIKVNTESSESIKLEWDRPTCVVEKYVIERDGSKFSPEDEVFENKSLDENSYSFLNNGLNENTRFCYTVIAYGSEDDEIVKSPAGNEIGRSNQACVKTRDVVFVTMNLPDFPELTQLEKTEIYNIEINIIFIDSEGLTKECDTFTFDPNISEIKNFCGKFYADELYNYTINYFYINNNDGKLLIATSKGDVEINEDNKDITFDDLNKNIDKDEDGVTNIVEIIEHTNPCPVEDINLKANEVTLNSVTLTWNKPTCNIQEYKVERESNGAELLISEPLTELAYNDAGLNADTNYCYTVVAYYQDGEIEDKRSNKICITTLHLDNFENIDSTLHLPPDVISIAGVESGAQTTFTAIVEDDAPLTEISYEWYIDGALLLDQASNPITIDNPAIGTRITVKVTDAKGASNTYTLIWGETVP